MEFVTGQALSLGEPDRAGVPVAKGWEVIRDDAGNLRTFLLEKVPYMKIRAALESLPMPQAGIGLPGTGKARLAKGVAPPASGPPDAVASATTRSGSLPPLAEKRPALQPVRLASRDPQLSAESRQSHG
jgi:hypothetical protein